MATAVQQLIDVPDELELRQADEYIRLANEAVQELLPSCYGRLWGVLLAASSSVIISNLPWLAFGAVRGAATVSEKMLIKAVPRVVTQTGRALSTSVLSTNRFWRFAQRVASKVIRNSGISFEAFRRGTKATKKRLMLWMILGITEDMVEETHVLTSTLLHNISAPKYFFEHAKENATAIRQFVDAFTDSIGADGEGNFKEYLLSRKEAEPLVPYQITLMDLCYYLVYLESVQRYVQTEVSVPKGQKNPHIRDMQHWLSVLLRAMLKNEISELIVSENFPIWDWFTGVPESFQRAMLDIGLCSASMRRILNDVEIYNSEALESVASALIGTGSAAATGGLERAIASGPLLKSTSTGVLAHVALKYGFGTARKLAPGFVRFIDTTM